MGVIGKCSLIFFRLGSLDDYLQDLAHKVEYEGKVNYVNDLKDAINEYSKLLDQLISENCVKKEEVKELISSAKRILSRVKNKLERGEYEGIFEGVENATVNVTVAVHLDD